MSLRAKIICDTFLLRYILDMGNAGSNQPKEWHKDHTSKQPDLGPSSPAKEGEAFTFDKKKDDERGSRDEDNNIEDGAPYYTKAVPEHEAQDTVMRERSNTLTESNKNCDSIDIKVLPTVFKWEGGGKQVGFQPIITCSRICFHCSLFNNLCYIINESLISKCIYFRYSLIFINLVTP